MSKQNAGTKNKVRVSAEWHHNTQPNPAFKRLLKLLLHPQTDKRRERYGDENGY